MNSSIKLLDDNNNLSDDFNETVELVLKGVHGDKFYDEDEELQDTRKIEIINEEETKTPKIEMKHKVTFKDFIPVLFFIVITIILIVGGYLFIDKFDLTSLLGK